jgi:hypothetical protein
LIRCASANTFEVLVVLVTPLPIRTRRTVILETAQGRLPLEAESVPPGSLLLLPPEATDAINAWKNLDELTIAVKASPTDIKGRIPLTDISGGLRKLTEGCGTS